MVSDPPRQQRTWPMWASAPMRASATARTRWPVTRMFPLLATIALLIVGMFTSTWGAHLIGQPEWSVPHDLWRTLVAADRVRRLELGGLYTPPTELVTFPGAALILVPIVALIDRTGLGLAFQSAGNPEPAAWLAAGPYEILLSATVLFAADHLAERCGADRRTRALLAFGGAIALWNVSVRFGHPEDAVAVALLLYGILALSNARPGRSAWLIGAAVAVQPLVLLGLPVVLAALPVRRMAAFLLRAALPAVVVLGAAAAANFSATLKAVTSQPNWPTSHSNHSTPWTDFAPPMGDGSVSAGPGRILAVLLALACAGVIGRRWPAGRDSAVWSTGVLQRLLWWVAATLALRCVFESVMVSFYLWPPLAVALVAAAGGLSRLLRTATAAAVLTVAAQASWPGPWLWWGCMTVGLGLTLWAALPSREERARAGSTCDPPARIGAPTTTGAATGEHG